MVQGWSKLGYHKWSIFGCHFQAFLPQGISGSRGNAEDPLTLEKYFFGCYDSFHDPIIVHIFKIFIAV